MLCGTPALELQRRGVAGLTDDEKTDETLALMWRHIRAGAADPIVQAWAESARATVAAGSSAATVAWAWWWWVKYRVRFVHDARAAWRWFGVDNPQDLLIAPAVLVRMADPAGDCDDFTMLVAAGLLALGLEPVLVVVAAEPDEPERFSHVYAGLPAGDGSFMALDASHGVAPGWEVPASRRYRRRVYGLAGGYREERMRQTSGEWPGLHGYTERPAIDWESMAGVNMAAGVTPIVLSGTAPRYSSVRRAPRQSAAALASRVHGVGAVSDAPGVDVSKYDWSDVFKSLALTSGQIAQQVIAPLQPGEYVQTAAGVRANQVAGALPGQYPGMGANLGGVGWGTLLLIGLAGFATVAMISRKGR